MSGAMSKPTTVSDDDVYWTMDWSKNNVPGKPAQETIFEKEKALARLLAEDVIFLNDHWREDDWPESARKSTSLTVICSDIFAWGCSDAETIHYEDIQGVYDAWIANREWGPSKWCAIKRNLKPQAPVIEAMKKAGVWDESMDALEDNQDTLESAPFDYAARSRRTASSNFSASVRASTLVPDT